MLYLLKYFVAIQITIIIMTFWTIIFSFAFTPLKKLKKRKEIICLHNAFKMFRS